MLRRFGNPDRAAWPELTLRPTLSLDAAVERVRPIVDAVRAQGDVALRQLTAQFDGVDLDELRVEQPSLARSESEISPELAMAIRSAIRNVERFHEAQRESELRIETSPGITCWRRSIPVERVGLYIPGGTAPLFSSVIMLGVPARIAGCRTIVLCTPPGKDGVVDPAIRFVANELGIDQVYRVGGAQAIAAMTYGTESVPKVDKLFGPGNQYVTAAKQLAALSGVAIDLPAGPTELAVVVDHSANPVFVAADLLSQAEHGADSQVVLIATDSAPLSAIEAEIERQLESLPRKDTALKALENSRCVVFPDLERCIEFANAYAAEHLILAVQHADSAAAHVTQAGSVFVGHLAPESLGDYASGTNHTLPTGGAARGFSGVSLDSFFRKTTFQSATEDGLRHIGPVVETMAMAEQLAGHARAVTHRLDTIGRDPNGVRRRAERRRTTKETDIHVVVDLDGSGTSHIKTGLGFFDHMLEQVSRHGGIDLDIRVIGDLHVDEHHTVEDTALALGACIKEALGDKRGIERYGFLLPMDEALAQVALDFSGRAWLVWDVPFKRERVGDVPTEMFEHFFRSFCDAAACNLNIQASGDNDHHVIESVFKGFARTLRTAVRKTGTDIPSTKGSL